MAYIPVILHIPHWSTVIPTDCREDILLDDDSLRMELLKMTDLYTEFAARGNWAEAVVLAEVSRLIVDVERFRDDENEMMTSVGMGAVYTRTNEGKLLRNYDHEKREHLLQRCYDPHHCCLTSAVEKTLEQFDRCLILDVHSFPSRPLPYELCQTLDRPDICIGVDEYHTPEENSAVIVDFYRQLGLKTKINAPFAGSMVPSKYYLQDKRVCSLMIEINRSLYMDEATGAIKAYSSQIFKTIRKAVTHIR